MSILNWILDIIENYKSKKRFKKKMEKLRKKDPFIYNH